MVNLDKETRSHLKKLQKSGKDKRVYIKATAILMLNDGLQTQQIADWLGIDLATLFRYQAAFLTEPLETYLKSDYQGYDGKLTDEQEAVLTDELRQTLYINSQEVVEFIAHQFGKSYTRQGTVALLHRLGFVYKKTTGEPCKADTQAQHAFLLRLQEQIENLDEDDALYFNDGVHPQHNTRRDYGWIQAGETFPMPQNSGRKRLNLNGALNAADVTDVVVSEENTINAQAVIGLWETLLKKHPLGTLYQVCDNAKYYHSKIVVEWLEKHPRCQVLFLPPYSPNLNLIERLWKYLRKEVISYHFYETFAEFREAVLDFFKNIKHHRQKLESLLTLNFHIASPH